MRSMLGVGISTGALWPPSGTGPPSCWRPHSCRGCGSCWVRPGSCTWMRPQAAQRVVWNTCTSQPHRFLTAMHTGGRSADDIDAGAILPGYTGTIVRDGYAGYAHLIDAYHAWCEAHLLRDLAAFHRADPQGQLWAAAMADTLTDAHHHAQAARAASLDPDVLSAIRRR